jgi:DNA polymerase III epsilon subunit-like protein
MIIFDIEGSGVDPEAHGILSIGAFDFNDPSRSFYEECRLREGAHVIPEALVVNGYTEETMHDASKQSEEELVKHFIEWVMSSSEHTVAGHIPAFDTAFIQAACARYKLEYPFAKRTVDMHSVAYAHMLQRGLTPPIEKRRSALDSNTIAVYVGIPMEPHPHIGINGAKWETEAFSRMMLNKPFFEEFKQYPIPWVK